MNLISIYRMVLYKFPNEIATIISNNLLCIYISSKYTRVNNNFRYCLLYTSSCFSDGIKFIVSLPILLLHWFGFISDETTRRAKHNWIIKLLNIIVTLVGFIGGLMSIVMGWNEFWQIIRNIF